MQITLIGYNYHTNITIIKSRLTIIKKDQSSVVNLRFFIYKPNNKIITILYLSNDSQMTLF